MRWILLDINFDEIKKLVIKSLFVDDDFYDLFVLKGGNALSLAYKTSNRSSKDVDVSMAEDFLLENKEVLKKLENAFEKIFKNSEYKTFDFKLSKRPMSMDEEKKMFWGGYLLEFKVIEREKYNESDMQTTRKTAINLGKKGSKSFTVDISKYEYTLDKQEMDFEGLSIFVYTPIMIINEKIRAICQQMEDYPVNTTRKPRPRDFFDIHLIFTTPECGVNDEIFLSEHNLNMLKEMFTLKKVPLELIDKISETYDFHNTAYESLKATVPIYIEVKEFKFYFDFVVEKVKKLNSLWIK